MLGREAFVGWFGWLVGMMHWQVVGLQTPMSSGFQLLCTSVLAPKTIQKSQPGFWYIVIQRSGQFCFSKLFTVQIGLAARQPQ
jgi:hypothetical protein